MMAESNISFNSEGAASIYAKLQSEAEKIQELFDEVEFMGDAFNGEDDTWKGVAQAKFYSNFKTITKKFPEIKESIEKNNEFLKMTIDNYNKGEQVVNQSVNNNKENLSINEG